MGVLRKNTKSYTSQPTAGPKGFVIRCIWYDGPNHKRGDCGSYADAMKNGIITFKEDRIMDDTTDEPLDTNFGREGMKNLLDVKLRMKNLSHGKEVDFYTIGAKHKVITSMYVSTEVMVRGSTNHKETDWDIPINATTIKAYLMSEHGEKEP